MASIGRQRGKGKSKTKRLKTRTKFTRTQLFQKKYNNSFGTVTAIFVKTNIAPKISSKILRTITETIEVLRLPKRALERIIERGEVKINGRE